MSWEAGVTWVWAGHPVSEMGGAGPTSRQVAPLSLCFCSRLIRHTKGLMESEEKLCVKVLRTLQQMLLKKSKYGDRVSVTDITGQGQALTGQDLAYPKPHFILPGQPATEDAAAELPPEPQVWRPGRAH